MKGGSRVRMVKGLAGGALLAVYDFFYFTPGIHSHIYKRCRSILTASLESSDFLVLHIFCA